MTQTISSIESYEDDEGRLHLSIRFSNGVDTSLSMSKDCKPMDVCRALDTLSAEILRNPNLQGNNYDI